MSLAVGAIQKEIAYKEAVLRNCNDILRRLEEDAGKERIRRMSLTNDIKELKEALRLL